MSVCQDRFDSAGMHHSSGTDRIGMLHHVVIVGGVVSLSFILNVAFVLLLLIIAGHPLTLRELMLLLLLGEKSLMTFNPNVKLVLLAQILLLRFKNDLLCAVELLFLSEGEGFLSLGALLDFQFFGWDGARLVTLA